MTTICHFQIFHALCDKLQTMLEQGQTLLHKIVNRFIVCHPNGTKIHNPLDYRPRRPRRLPHTYLILFSCIHIPLRETMNMILLQRVQTSESVLITYQKEIAVRPSAIKIFYEVVFSNNARLPVGPLCQI